METKSVIRDGLDCEIEAALSLYFNNNMKLSKTYWPRSFRLLLTTIFEFLLQNQNIWTEFNTTRFTVDEKILTKLINELALPTSPYIQVRQREWIRRVLLKLSVYRKKLGFEPQFPHDNSYLSSDWPQDIEDKDDLIARISTKTLRDDVKNFIWKILSEVVPLGKYCNVHHLSGKNLKHCLPIKIEVPEDYVDKVKVCIDTVSYQANHDSFLPNQLIEIVGIPERPAPIDNEEAFCESGT